MFPEKMIPTILAQGLLAAMVVGFSFGGTSARAEESESFLPAADIAKAINASELTHDDTQEESYSDEEDLPPVDLMWEPWAMPEAVRSWILFNVPPAALEKLERNEDQHGDPLFRRQRG
jgi:hypothetical protein